MIYSTVLKNVKAHSLMVSCLYAKGGRRKIMRSEKWLRTIIAMTVLFSCVTANHAYAYDSLDEEENVEEVTEIEEVVEENSVEENDEAMVEAQANEDEAVIATVAGDVTKALDEIVTPLYEADGTIKEYPLSETLISHLTSENLVATKDDEAKTLTIDQQLNGAFLTSDYINGKSEAGISYYNMMNFYATLIQARQMLEANPEYQIVDNQGAEYDLALIEEFIGLVKQINDFDPTTDLQYDWESAYDTESFAKETYRGGVDVIATSKEGNISFEFHIDSHGWWGYDLGAHDSITGLILGLDANEAYDRQRELTIRYGRFFVIEMGEDEHGTWYMLDGTDLQNPMMYVSKDGSEAFMIDVDFYGGYALNSMIKGVIGENCESLKIFLTHNHADHVNNLGVIASDDELREMTTIIWPENEPYANTRPDETIIPELANKDVITTFDWPSVVTVKDMEKFTAAGVEFQFIEIPDEHTPGGGQLADLDHKIIYSGDTLGAQIHLGGTTMRSSGAQAWLDGARKVAQYIQENGMRYNIGGHAPCLCDPDFANWLATGIEYAMENAQDGYNLIIVENGVVVNGTNRFNEIMANGLSDREELVICSLGYIKEAPQDPENPTTPENPDEPTTPETLDDNITTGDSLNVTPIVGVAGLAMVALAVVVVLKKKNELN